MSPQQSALVAQRSPPRRQHCVAPPADAGEHASPWQQSVRELQSRAGTPHIEVSLQKPARHWIALLVSAPQQSLVSRQTCPVFTQVLHAAFAKLVSSPQPARDAQDHAPFVHWYQPQVSCPQPA